MQSKGFLDLMHTKLYPIALEIQKIQANNLGAKYRGATGNITLEEWFELIRKYKYVCLCCHQQEPNIILTIDHVIPISKGGPNVINNIQPLCGPCNYKKGRKSTDYR